MPGPNFGPLAMRGRYGTGPMSGHYFYPMEVASSFGALHAALADAPPAVQAAAGGMPAVVAASSPGSVPTDATGGVVGASQATPAALAPPTSTTTPNAALLAAYGAPTHYGDTLRGASLRSLNPLARRYPKGLQASLYAGPGAGFGGLGDDASAAPDVGTSILTSVLNIAQQTVPAVITRAVGAQLPGQQPAQQPTLPYNPAAYLAPQTSTQTYLLIGAGVLGVALVGLMMMRRSST